MCTETDVKTERDGWQVCVGRERGVGSIAGQMDDEWMDGR